MSMSGPRGELLRRIAELWRGDWSAMTFDGKDGSGWILTALDGDEDELQKLAQELTEVEQSYH